MSDTFIGVDYETDMTLNVVARRNNIRNINGPEGDDECDTMPVGREVIKYLYHLLPLRPSQEDMEERLEKLLKTFYSYRREKRRRRELAEEMRKKRERKDDTDLRNQEPMKESESNDPESGEQEGIEDVNCNSVSDADNTRTTSCLAISTSISGAQLTNDTVVHMTEASKLLNEDIPKESDIKPEQEIAPTDKDDDQVSEAQLKEQAKQTAHFVCQRLFHRKRVLGYNLEKFIPDTLGEFRWIGCCDPRTDYMSESKLKWDCEDDNDENWVDVKGKLKGESLKEFSKTRVTLKRGVGGFGHHTADMNAVGTISKNSVKVGSDMETGSEPDALLMTPSTIGNSCENSGDEYLHLEVTSSEERLLVTPPSENGDRYGDGVFY